MSENESKTILSFADIQAADDIETEDVFIPEWGGNVTVKVFTKAEANDIRRHMESVAEAGGGKAEMDEFERQVILTGLIAPSISAEQYNLLLEKSNKAINRLSVAIMDINGMSEGQDEKDEADFRP